MGRAVAVDVRGVSKVFDGGRAPHVRALDTVSVGILENEFFTLLGPSGCGKTTLLRLIAGFEQPTAGEILLHGARIDHLPPYRRPINTVFQSYALFPHLSVAENVAFGLDMQKRKPAEIAAQVQRMLHLVKLGDLGARRPDQLSGGQQQRVALARALASQPRVLLLDEPLSALDLKLRKEMQIELKRLQTETGITFVFVTHDQEEALTMSDRIAVMSEGRIVQMGSPRDIYETPATRYVADFIGETDFLDATLVATEGSLARWRLASGAELVGQAGHDLAPGTRATLSTRPERLSLLAEGGAGLAGTIEACVYFGTDTTVHVALDGGGGSIRVREQSHAGAVERATGTRVTVALPPAAVRPLVA
ncbi:ABC transporter ATP-binding protein [Zavarzinia sp. CC-PAN008]|uniref:ABC transporter ATP-binding protein n=1 Tax=Zavarzinia sp. CC-PAN008 TaxID=3243332 RepID=UPI003F743DAE